MFPDMEVPTFYMLHFINSPGDHRAWVINVSTHFIIGELLHVIDHPARRRLVMRRPKVFNIFNEILEEEFKMHRIEERINVIDNLTMMYGRPGPMRLRSMIIE